MLFVPCPRGGAGGVSRDAARSNGFGRVDTEEKEVDVLKRIILLVLVLALLAGGFYYVRRVDAQDQSQIRNLYAEVEPLQQEKEALEKERAAIAEEYDILLRDPSTVQILFRELDEEIFTEVYPIMRDRGIKGVLGLSLKQFPGQRTKLSMNQFNRLTMDGWGTCLAFDTDYRTRFAYWLKTMQDMITKNGLAQPTAIFFPDNSYDPETMDAVLLEAGIQTVVVNAEDGHSETISDVGDLWFTGALPWNYTGIGGDVERLSVTDGANLVFTISIKNMWDAYEEESFTSLLDSWEKILVRDSILDDTAKTSTSKKSDETTVEPMLKVTTLEDAREAHREAAVSRDSLLKEQEQREAELDAKIEALRVQIDEIYAVWNSK